MSPRLVDDELWELIAPLLPQEGGATAIPAALGRTMGRASASIPGANGAWANSYFAKPS